MALRPVVRTLELKDFHCFLSWKTLKPFKCEFTNSKNISWKSIDDIFGKSFVRIALQLVKCRFLLQIGKDLRKLYDIKFFRARRLNKGVSSCGV